MNPFRIFGNSSEQPRYKQNPSVFTSGPLPDLSGSYETRVHTSSGELPATIRIEQNGDEIFVTASLSETSDSGSFSSPKLFGKLTDRNRHHVIVTFENGTSERYVFTEGRFSRHEFLFPSA
ncbi:hypothetical protein EHQ12_17905 [Leptospira gomenensis]|uniref:Uncharacterized protein n=1 Tax=Leptospira gomenensis TaxID=2484974 RepID=A0A5F1YCW9_9LEPT|nr:hypothetical protein [Leptospira gomenensis]TGK33212.1 hypothetical protein EHQ12_17905 [Leptospira gomenensis]TGK35555.1 hypothetical protein EHQ17_06420 [Leptospira gomenensis]TGK40879.1 hypothetical protein EHQ07_17380 [Leptospira gomenensis]TGK61169.1 hypothetical protein EHQ13_09915 [Leptospira gomenensis]